MISESLRYVISIRFKGSDDRSQHYVGKEEFDGLQNIAHECSKPPSNLFDRVMIIHGLFAMSYVNMRDVVSISFVDQMAKPQERKNDA